jgi:hypothetical protein
MLTDILPVVLALIFGSVCFAVGYGIGARSGRKRRRELSDALEESAARFRQAIQKQTEVVALKESEAEEWKGCYETMVQSYDSMKQAYEGMKQAAESYEEASTANRQAYEGMKTAYETLLDTVKKYENMAPR